MESTWQAGRGGEETQPQRLKCVRAESGNSRWLSLDCRTCMRGSEFVKLQLSADKRSTSLVRFSS